ncbi:MAG: MBL fold metallo-hydrolase [Archangiaceae bacterium]|nr:MBL fold metallo-hydrolase [Archangiaceae bacterium]
MRGLRLMLVTSMAGCATVPLPEGAAAGDVEQRVEVQPCVVFGERHDRRRYEGVAELSLEPWHQAIATIVLQHPTVGTIVLDPAFGVEIAHDLSRVPPWFRVVSGSAEGKQPAVDGLQAAGIDPRSVREVLLTHSHWDHTGGVRDLPRATVRMSQPEYAYVGSLEHYLEPGVLRHQLDRAWKRIEPFGFEGPAVLRFEGSHDVFGDGSVIAVPLPGHTPGSAGFLVRGAGGKRWIFTGDSTWTLRGIEKPAHKTVPIDLDRAVTGESIGRLHALHLEHPEIEIVPAHDADALDLLPVCGSP